MTGVIVDASVIKFRGQGIGMPPAIVADPDDQLIEALVGFEEHGFGVSVLQVRCGSEMGESAYFPPCTADPGLALVVLPDGWLTHGALVEAARIHLRCSGEWGPVRGNGEEVIICYWVSRADRQSGDGLPVFLHPDGKMIC